MRSDRKECTNFFSNNREVQDQARRRAPQKQVILPHGAPRLPFSVYDLTGQAMNGERKNGVAKGRECALKYAAGVRTRGERRYAIFERTVNDMPVAYRLAMEENRRLSILWFSVPFLKELFVLLLRIVSSPPGCSGNETARVRRQPLWEKRFRRFS